MSSYLLPASSIMRRNRNVETGMRTFAGSPSTSKKRQIWTQARPGDEIRSRFEMLLSCRLFGRPFAALPYTLHSHGPMSPADEICRIDRYDIGWYLWQHLCCFTVPDQLLKVALIPLASRAGHAPCFMPHLELKVYAWHCTRTRRSRRTK